MNLVAIIVSSKVRGGDFIEAFRARSLKNKLNFSKKVIINLSLNYDNLTKRDVLNLICRSLHLDYDKVRGWSLEYPLTSMFKLMKYLLLYLGVCAFYFFSPIHHANLKLKKDQIPHH